ncbi:MAG TPA: 2-hydroxyacid dehydrogenase [Firmicutes bacterium]|nr:2-hydroxyacid dehydrogenase [Bacillota bacterium]
MRIAFFDAKEYDVDFFTNANKGFDFELRFFADRLDCSNADMASGFDAVCCFVNDRVSADALECIKENGIRLLLLRCAGVNNVDLATAERLGVCVMNVPEYSSQGVAEHTLALILALNRKIHKAYLRTKEYNFSLKGLLGFNMAGKTAGIIGLGRIGRAVADLLKAFSCRIIAHDIYADKKYAQENAIELVSLDELYAQSDIITLHCPLTEENRHLINSESISKMKMGVMFINISRGGLVDTQALIDGLKSKIISSVGLDVYEEEENYFYEDFTDSILGDDTLLELLALPNVLVTSHQAYFTVEALEAIANTTLQNASDFALGKELKNKVIKKR